MKEEKIKIKNERRKRKKAEELKGKNLIALAEEFKELKRDDKYCGSSSEDEETEMCKDKDYLPFEEPKTALRDKRKSKCSYETKETVAKKSIFLWLMLPPKIRLHLYIGVKESILNTITKVMKPFLLVMIISLILALKSTPILTKSKSLLYLKH